MSNGHDVEVVKTRGAGGNITLTPGDGQPQGSIILFLADGREMMRFDPDGKIYVRGEQVDDNLAVYLHFGRWLQLACVTPPDKD
jgi:hypothetical protein